jgi:mannose-6-phosphate isomerase-like protein (cupin superfamily)
VAEQTDFGFQMFAAKPKPIQSGKSHEFLARSDILNGSVQVIAAGGENNLHAHTGSDEIWFVLEGTAKFYTEEDREVATLGRHEGLLIPRGAPYWFESVGSEQLVVMRFGAKAAGVEDKRIDYTPPSETIRDLLATLPRD